MNRWTFLVGVVGTSAAALFVACSSETASIPPPEDAGTDGPEDAVVPADGGAATCSLGDATSGRASCDDCNQKRCCVAIMTCLDDRACEIMNNCISRCNIRFGKSEAGADCIRECAKNKEETAKKLTDMRECTTTRCGSECKE